MLSFSPIRPSINHLSAALGRRIISRICLQKAVVSEHIRDVRVMSSLEHRRLNWTWKLQPNVRKYLHFLLRNFSSTLAYLTARTGSKAYWIFIFSVHIWRLPEIAYKILLTCTCVHFPGERIFAIVSFFKGSTTHKVKIHCNKAFAVLFIFSIIEGTSPSIIHWRLGVGRQSLATKYLDQEETTKNHR